METLKSILEYGQALGYTDEFVNKHKEELNAKQRADVERDERAKQRELARVPASAA